MLPVKEVITNVVFNNMNQLISKEDINNLLDEIILTDDIHDPLFRLIGHSNDNIYYLCFTHNTVIVINALTNYLNHSESENHMLSTDIFNAITCEDEIDYECFVNTEVEDEYSPLISASNNSEVISIQKSLPDMSGLLKIDSSNSVLKNDENKNCLICYEKSKYCCSVCKYPICSKCAKIINNSSCKCPCCQSVPLSLITLIDNNDDEVKYE